MEQKKTFSIDEAVKFSWEQFKARPWLIIAYFLVLYLASTVPSFAADFFPEASVIFWALILIGILLSFVAAVGIARFTLNIADKKEPTWNDAFADHTLWWKALLGSILYQLIVFVGILLLVVPGIIWAVKYSQFLFVLVDEKNIGPVEALRRSGQITSGVKGTLVLLWVVFALINVVGLLALFVGMLVTVPMTYMAQAHVYRLLASQTPKSPASK